MFTAILYLKSGSAMLALGVGVLAGAGIPHFLVNRSAQVASYLEVGDRTSGDAVTYPDDDIEARMKEGRWTFTHKDGTPY